MRLTDFSFENPRNGIGSPHHVPALDGLRGLAVLLVICLHYFPKIDLFSIGWCGVDLFFVLSGYLITGRLLETRNNKNYFRQFYRNRVLRIFPLYFAVLIAFFIAISWFAKKQTEPLLSYYFQYWLSFFTFSENWVFIAAGLPPSAYLLHFWSLAIEEQFYLVWPFFIYLQKNIKRGVTICLALTAAVLIIRTIIYVRAGKHFEAYYFNTLCRADGFFIGAMFRMLLYNERLLSKKFLNMLQLISLMVIVAGMLIFKNADLENPAYGTIGYTFFALFFGCLLYRLVIPTPNILKRIFSSPILRFCGKISYGLYIFHWPVLLILQDRLLSTFGRLTPVDTLNQGFTIVICLLLTFTISYLSYKYFESFFLRLKKH